MEISLEGESPDNFGSWDNSKRTAQEEEGSGRCKATDSRSLPNPIHSRNHQVCRIFFQYLSILSIRINLYRLAMFRVSIYILQVYPIKLKVGHGLLLCIFWAVDLRTLEVSDPLKPEPMSGLTRVTCGAWVS